MERLREIQKEHPAIGDVRGRGLMIGAELVSDRAAKTRAKELRDRVIERCFEKGLLILGCGANTVRWAPPLVVDRATIDRALEIFSETLDELGA